MISNSADPSVAQSDPDAQTIGHSLELLDAAATQLESSREAIARPIETLTEQLHQFQQAIQTKIDGIEIESVMAVLTQLQEAGAEETLDDSVESIQETVDTVDQALIEAQTTWEECCENAKESLTELTSEVDQLEEILSQTQETIQATISEFSNTLSHLKAQVQTFQTETEESFEEFQTELVETHFMEIETQFSQIIEAVGQTQASELGNQMGEFSEGTSRLFETFSTDANALSDQLGDRAGQLLEDTGHHCTDTLQQELENSVQSAIEDAISAFTTEITESIALMGVGCSVTSSISPALPALVTTKRLAELGNAGLDLIGL